MTFWDYLMFNLLIAGGVLSIISTVFLGIWFSDSLIDKQPKQTCLAALLLASCVLAGCAIFACGFVVGDRMFENDIAIKLEKE